MAKRLACLVFAVATLATCNKTSRSIKSTPPAAAGNTAIDVRVDAATGMSRGGKPHFVKGAGGSDNLKELASRGANSLRTWTTGGLAAILDEAHGLGLTVSAGIWLEPECSWFSYMNPAHCEKQAERVRKEVTEFRNHPALLTWGIGNEAEGDGTNADYWNNSFFPRLWSSHELSQRPSSQKQIPSNTVADPRKEPRSRQYPFFLAHGSCLPHLG